MTNPLFMAYASDAHLRAEQFSGTTAVFISGQRNDNTLAQEWQNVRSRGSEVYEYRIQIERPNSRVSAFDELSFMGDSSLVPLWPYLDTSGNQRSQNTYTKLTDIRVGSPWVSWCVDSIAELIRAKRCDGVFLDGFGGQLWGAAGWSGWPVGEQQEWQAGAVDFARKLDEMRRAEDPNFILVGNNSWQFSPAGEQYMDGICIENAALTNATVKALAGHPYSNLGHRRVLSISSTNANALAWAAVPGVTHVWSSEANIAAGSSKYSYPTKAVVGYANLRDDSAQVLDLQQRLVVANSIINAANATISQKTAECGTLTASLNAANDELNAARAFSSAVKGAWQDLASMLG